MSDANPAASVNIPQLLVLLVLAFLALRWYLSSSSSSARSQSPSQQSRNAGRNRNAVNAAAVDQVAAMFPQLSRLDIAWDLQRNGGSVQATTERVLAGQRLEAPPPTFQPNLPAPESATTVVPSRPAPSRSQHPDLITRYKLHDKVNRPEENENSDSQSQHKQGWSQSKAERQALLQRRREEMILAARRKMEQNDQKKAGA